MQRLYITTTVSDIFKYKASQKMQHNRSDEIAKRLPIVFQQRLHDVVARDIEVKSSIVTFYGGASRTATKRHRLVTNWNLLSGVSRGAIQIRNNHTNFTVSFWLGLPKVSFLYSFLFLMGLSLFPAITIYLYGESLLEIILGIVMPIIIIGFLMMGVNFTIVIVRFHLFVWSCVNRAKREVENQLLSI
ncbi:MAG: hypothetical protein H6658_11655 [Ardenticatenaceae bacterium]|nr:hypothetical protein [Ardenticatenaceae bacterium]